MAKRLTDRFIATAAPPATGRLEITDALAPGLTFRLSADGSSSWCVRYQPRGQNQRRITIGSYVRGNTAAGLSLADARARAGAIAAAARRGIDLVVEEAREVARVKRIARAPGTLGALLALYVEKHCKPNQRRWLLTERMLAQHVLPMLGDRSPEDLRRADIAELLDHLKTEKGLNAQVNRVRSQLLAAFNWALEREYVEINPAAGIRPRRIEVPRDRVLNDDELRALWLVAEELPAPSGPFIQMLLLTAGRRDEVRSMRWSELSDPMLRHPSLLWVLPGARNKSRRDHHVPITSHMRGALVRQPRIGRTVDALVFTVDGIKAYAGMRALKQRLDRETGITDWVFHDLRRTVRTRLASLGIAREVSERLLNHAAPRLELTYNHHGYEAEKRAALERWGDHLMEIVGAVDNTVVQFAKR